MVDTESDFLKPEFLYLPLFENCNILVKPFVLSGKFEQLMQILEIFFRIDKYDTETIDLLFTQENLEILLENYGASSNLEGEKVPLIFFPQVSKEMHETLQNHPEIRFLGVQGNNQESQIIFQDYQKIAIYDKKLGKFTEIIPDSLLDEKSKKTIEYEWCKMIIEMYKANPQGDEVFEYLISIWNAVGEIYSQLCGILNEMEFYTILNDFSKNERKIILRICGNLFSINIGGLIGNPEKHFMNIEKKIKGSKSSGCCNSLTNEIENSEFQGKMDEKSGDLALKSLNLQEKQFDDKINNEILSISLISNDLFLALQSTIDEIPTSLDIRNPNEKYVLLRKTIWKNGIPVRIIEKILLLYIEEHFKNKRFNDKIELNNYLENMFDKFKPYMARQEKKEIVINRIISTYFNQKKSNFSPHRGYGNTNENAFDFNHQIRKNLQLYERKFDIKSPNVLKEINGEKKRLISALMNEFN